MVAPCLCFGEWRGRLSMCLFRFLCLSQHTNEDILFSLSACALSPSILLLCVRASCVLSVSVYLKLRPLTSFQKCFELVFRVLLFSVFCQHSLCCSFKFQPRSVIFLQFYSGWEFIIGNVYVSVVLS